MENPQEEERPHTTKKFGKKIIDTGKYIEDRSRRQNVQSKRLNNTFTRLVDLRKMCDLDSYLITITQSANVKSQDHGYLRGFGSSSIRQLEEVFFQDTGGSAVREFLDMTIDDLATMFCANNEPRKPQRSTFPIRRNRGEGRSGGRQKRKTHDHQSNGKEEPSATTPTSEDGQSPHEIPSEVVFYESREKTLEGSRRIVATHENNGFQITVGNTPSQNESIPSRSEKNNKEAKRRKRGGG